MTDTKWATRIEASTLAEADMHRETWSDDDIAFVIEFTDDERDEEIARALGRSLFAIWSIQHRIATGDLGSREQRLTEARRRDAAPTYTFVGDDVPPGW